MKLFKPSWFIQDDNKPIFSIDIHPAGKRFATGGQGVDSGRVVVWNLDSVLNEDVEMDQNIPKMLCQMDNHLACVNCVRWSNNGKYLASAGDDKLVMIWSLSNIGGSSTFGSSGKANVETWRCVHTLRGHAGDVLDLSWSPLDKWLASCSVDNKIIIWNAVKFPEMVSVLNGHLSLVKGVSWDPVGKYLATQSDDKSLRIWKTADWTHEATITEPFEECGATTHVLRLDWSPDGQYIISAHAMNGGGPTAQIIERKSWKCDKDLVGHRKAITCVRFNGNILVKENKKYCCAAVGSRDRSLSIWLTSLKRPLAVINELFSDSVLDLSWSADGLNLLACSWDGTVACIQFSNHEIGIPLTPDEKNALYERTYGKCLATECTTDLANANILVECPEILLAREKVKTDVKKEEKKKEPISELNKIVVGEQAATTPPKMEKISQALNVPPVASSSPLRPRDRQIETRTSDGKRRITPIFIPLHLPTQSESSATESCFSTSSQNKSRIRVERRDDIIIHPNVSNHSINTSASNQSMTSFSGTAAIIQANEKQDVHLDNRLKRKAASALLPGPRTEDVCKKQKLNSDTKVAQQSHTSITSNGSFSESSYQPIIPTPTLGANGPVVRYAGKYRIQVINNAINTPHGKFSRLQLLPGNSVSSEPVWETYLNGSVSCVVCGGIYTSVSIGNIIYVYRISNSIMLNAPPLYTDSSIVKLWIAPPRLAALTARASLHLWDLQKVTALRPSLSLGHLLSPQVTVSNMTLSEQGIPTVSLSNGKSFIFCDKLLTWIVMSDTSDALYKIAKSTLNGTNMQTFTKGNYQSGATQSWLECQLSTSLHLKQASEYKHWLMALISHLVTHGTENTLRRWLDEMLGPAHSTAKYSSWESKVLGMDRHVLLSEMLTLLVRDLRWQRLHSEYKEQLDMALKDEY